MGLFTSNPLPDPVSDSAPPVDEHPLRIAAVLEHLRHSADTRITHPRRFRAGQLRALEKMLAERTGEFVDALNQDLGRGPRKQSSARLMWSERKLTMPRSTSQSGWIPLA